MNKPVNFELAKLLKEKGFNKRGYLQDVWLGNRYEGKHPKVKEIPVFGLGSTSVLPTIADVVMWLYEEHEIWIECLHRGDMGDFTFKISKLKKSWRTEPHYIHESGYNSPTEAYEAAIEYVLKNLI